MPVTLEMPFWKIFKGAATYMSAVMLAIGLCLGLISIPWYYAGKYSCEITANGLNMQWDYKYLVGCRVRVKTGNLVSLDMLSIIVARPPVNQTD